MRRRLSLTFLDWRKRSHWSPRLAACRDCRGRTHLRDDAGQPQHKVCAEHDIADDHVSQRSGETW
jgi:hypothetical protein